MDPASTGGERLPGTDGAAYLGGRPFSLSPNGRWLLFASADEGAAESDDLPAIMRRVLASYVLYDLERREGSRVGLAPDAERFIAGGAQILPDGGCWVPEGDGWRVVLRDSFNRFVGADPRVTEPRWEVADLDDAVARRWCQVDRHAPPDRNRTVGPFRVRGSGTRRVTITDGAGARTFAVHRKRLTFGSLLLGNLALGPDQRRLAYTITPALGSFVGNPRSFVVDQRRPDGGATSLAAPAYALAWSADGSRLYALVGPDSDSAIYVWGF